ncbi:MAG: hypothetical protein RL120_10315, partial [Gammaproteobacteria bacterium]
MAKAQGHNSGPPSSGTSPLALSLDQVARDFRLPFALIVVLLLLSAVPRILDNSILAWSFWASATALLGWMAYLVLQAARQGQS